MHGVSAGLRTGVSRVSLWPTDFTTLDGWKIPVGSGHAENEAGEAFDHWFQGLFDGRVVLSDDTCLNNQPVNC